MVEIETGPIKTENRKIYAPRLTAVQGLNVEESFSSGDLRRPSVYTLQELRDWDVRNMEHYHKSFGRKRECVIRMWIIEN